MNICPINNTNFKRGITIPRTLRPAEKQLYSDAISALKQRGENTLGVFSHDSLGSGLVRRLYYRNIFPGLYSEDSEDLLSSLVEKTKTLREKLRIDWTLHAYRDYFDFIEGKCTPKNKTIKFIKILKEAENIGRLIFERIEMKYQDRCDTVREFNEEFNQDPDAYIEDLEDPCVKYGFLYSDYYQSIYDSLELLRYYHARGIEYQTTDSFIQRIKNVLNTVKDLPDGDYIQKDGKFVPTKDSKPQLTVDTNGFGVKTCLNLDENGNFKRKAVFNRFGGWEYYTYRLNDEDNRTIYRNFVISPESPFLERIKAET